MSAPETFTTAVCVPLADMQASQCCRELDSAVHLRIGKVANHIYQTDLKSAATRAGLSANAVLRAVPGPSVSDGGVCLEASSGKLCS